MASHPQTKFRAIAAALEKEILDGEWQPNEKFPSVRAIAETYSIALATASRVLEVLHGKGLIAPLERSGVFAVCERVAAKPTVESVAVCLRITPGPWQRGSLAVVSSGFLQWEETSKLQFDFDTIPTDLALPRAALRAKVRAAQAAGRVGLILLPSRLSEVLREEDEQLLSVCREQRFPVVLLERYLRGDHRPLEWDLVCPDDFDGGYQCAIHLLEGGRRNLAFVRGGPISSHNDMLAGFLSAHAVARRRRLIPSDQRLPAVLDFPEDAPAREAYRKLCDQIAQGGFNGVVCYQDRVVIGVAIELMSRGIRVPKHVALTGFDDQVIGQEFTLGVTTYAFPSRDIAMRAVQLLRERAINPTASPVKVLVPSRLIVRESSK